MQSKNCKKCGNIFFKKINCSQKNWDTTSKFCSRECSLSVTLFKKGHITNIPYDRVPRGEKSHFWKGGQFKKICAICNINFLVDRDRDDAKTCSLDCFRLYQKSIEYRTHLSEVQRSKIDVELRKLTDTIGKFKNLLRCSSRYKIWRDQVRKRDHFTCQECRKKAGKLHVDHIESFINIIVRNNITSYEQAIECSDLWNTNNGRTLCIPCHLKTDTYGRRSHLSFTSKINQI